MENKDKVNEPEIEKEAGACEENAPEKELTREEQLLLEIEKLKAELKEKDDKYLRMAAEYDNFRRRSREEKDDKYLRMAAEYENFRRRSREEKDATYESAMADTVAELLPIIDNLERAANYDDGEKVKEGLAMTLKSVSAVFSSMGIEAVGAAGESFDPNLHNAVMHVEDEAYGEGEITEVFQKGYKKNKRVIRFAMVKTAN